MLCCFFEKTLPRAVMEKVLHQVVELVDWIGQRRIGRHVHQSPDKAVVEVIDPAVQMGAVVSFPGGLHDGGLGKVEHLALDVQLDEAIDSFIFGA